MRNCISAFVIISLVLSTFFSVNVAAQSAAATQPTSQPSFTVLAQELIQIHNAEVAHDKATIKRLSQQLAAALPADPPDPSYTPVVAYFVSPLGNDNNRGTPAAPYFTVNRAYQAAKANPSKLTGIYLDARGIYTAWSDFLMGNGGGNLYVDGSWNAADPTQRATLKVQANTFTGINVHNVHLRRLHLVPFSGPGTANTEIAGVYIQQGGDDISLDRCVVDGFRGIGVALCGGVTHARVYRCWIGNTFDPNLNTETCSGLYTECISPDIECNVLYHNGWQYRTPFDPNDPANTQEKQQMVFRHGWYENPLGGASVAGTDKFNIYLRNAENGHQGRVGNHHMLWGVYWDNGNSADCFTGAGWNANQGGEIGYCACFGNLTPDFYCWGGGFAGQSVADNIHDCLFAGSSASMQLNSPVTIQWTGGNSTPVPLPENTTATVSNCRGYWQVQPAVAVLSDRTATITNVNIVPAPAGVHVPTLGDYWGFNGTSLQVEQQIAARLQNPEPQQAQRIVVWLASQLPQ